MQLTESVPTNTTFVSFTAPAGWTPTTPASGGTGAITATRPTLAASAVAVFTLVVKVDLSTPHNTVLSNTASISTTTTDLVSGNNSDTEMTTVNSLIISGRKYTDNNGDGDDETGADRGLNGVTIELYNDVNSNGTYEAGTDTLAATTTTANISAQDGRYSFSGITPGRYIVREVLPAGYQQTAPAAPGIYAVNRTGGGAFADRDFGNFQLITISGRKFDDLNGNGNDNGGSHRGLNGFTIELYNDVNGNGTLELSGGTPDTLKATTTTANSGADGKYCSPMSARQVHVREISCGLSPDRTCAPGTYAVTAASGVN